MNRFLPRLAKTALEQSLEESGIFPVKPELKSIDGIEKSITCKNISNETSI
ncbi:hypothetical protein DPMN_037581 [Dreissena polymorpha]|uniref:Uncharacterized protein n=1 Tax=Dreissena polymorpha TaxID=45954 RepID=A0A9D4MDS9_DREPO|nr:hypothetical protein DPMN_037581 [Dreissena polymorpha]